VCGHTAYARREPEPRIIVATRERTTKEVVDDARTHLSELVDAHVSLAKAELAETQRQFVAGIAPLVVAGVLGLYVLGFFAVTAVKGLDNYVTEGWAWLIVSGGVTVIAGILAAVGISKLKKLDPSPHEAQESIQETVTWAKHKAGRDS
jgi:hypothetical protein